MSTVMMQILCGWGIITNDVASNVLLLMLQFLVAGAILANIWIFQITCDAVVINGVLDGIELHTIHKHTNLNGHIAIS